MVMLDRAATLQEGDLMWAIAIILNRPLPPFLNHHPTAGKMPAPQEIS